MATVTKAADAHTLVTTGWTNPSNAFATAGDNAYATAAPGKNLTVNGDFGFPAFTTSDIPAGSTINSVTVTVEWGMTAAVTGGALGVQLRNGGTALGSETTKTTTAEAQSTQQATSGIALADLQVAGTVKARVRCTKGNTTNAMTGNLDFVTLTVDYTAPAPAIGLSKTSSSLSASAGSTTAVTDPFTITDTGSSGTTLSYTVSDDQSWLSVSPTSGTEPQGGAGDSITISCDPTGLAAGVYTGTVTVTDAAASNNPRTVAVTFAVIDAASDGRGTEINADAPAVWMRFNESAGAALLMDRAGLHHGTPSGGTTIGATGQQGNAVAFDGTDDKVVLDTLGAVGSSLLTSTWEFWIKTTSAALGSVFGVLNTGTAEIVGVYLNSAGEVLSVGATEFHIRDASNALSIRGTISANIYDGNWHHVVFLPGTDANSHEVYVDNVSQTISYNVGSGVTSDQDFTHPLALGCRNNRGTYERFGAFTLEDFAVYTSRLTPTRIAAHYNASASGTSVSTTRDITYDIAAPVSTSRAVAYDIQNAVSADRALAYDVLNAVVADRQLSYDVIAAVSAGRVISYDIAATGSAVAADRVLAYDLLNAVVAGRALAYDVVNAVVVARALAYDLLNPVSTGRVVVYDVQNGVVTARVLSYDVIAAVLASRALSYDVIAPVGRDVAVIYQVGDVAGGAGQLATLWIG